MNKWIDLSTSLNNSIPVWPGTERFRITRKSKRSVVSSSFSLFAHYGTHIDAPLHCIKNGKTVDQIDVNSLCGLVQIIDVRKSRRIEVSHLRDMISYNVFFKTSNTMKGRFTKNYCYMTPEVCRRLVKLKTRIVGTNYLSIEKYGNKKFESHRILLKNDVLIIEGLNLSSVNEGLYQMVALPLKICAEASPIRVIVKKVGET